MTKPRTELVICSWLAGGPNPNVPPGAAPAPGHVGQSAISERCARCRRPRAELAVAQPEKRSTFGALLVAGLPACSAEPSPISYRCVGG